MIYQLHIVACHYFHINLAFSPVNRRLMSAFKAAGLQLLCAKISDRASLVLCGNKTDRFLPSLVVIVVLLFLSTSSSSSSSRQLPLVVSLARCFHVHKLY